MVGQVSEYMLHAATYLATLRKVETKPSLLGLLFLQLQRNFSLRDMLRGGGVKRTMSSATCLATSLRGKLQKIVVSCNSAFSLRAVVLFFSGGMQG